MRAFRLFLCLLAGVAGPKVVIHAQTTSSCFEIESILVDACAPETPTREGLNEMVRFLVGPNSLNVSDLSVTWATGANAWQGICRNATTASKVANSMQVSLHADKYLNLRGVFCLQTARLFW